MNKKQKETEKISNRPQCRWLITYLHPITLKSYKASPCSAYEKAKDLGEKWTKQTKGLGHFVILDLNNVSEVNHG